MSCLNDDLLVYGKKPINQSLSAHNCVYSALNKLAFGYYYITIFLDDPVLSELILSSVVLSEKVRLNKQSLSDCCSVGALYIVLE